VDKLLGEKEAERSGEKPKPKVKPDGTVKTEKGRRKDAPEVKEIKRDDSEEYAVVKSWPADVQKEWSEFHNAMRERQRFHKEQLTSRRRKRRRRRRRRRREVTCSLQERRTSVQRLTRGC